MGADLRRWSRKECKLTNLKITEIKAFVPPKNFEVSKQFYKDLGFTMASDGDGIAYHSIQPSGH
jgi:hypothetical protein